MLQDLRFALRLLVKERWFSAVAIVALSLGIGLNATVFTLVNAVLIRGLPFKDSQNLYMLGWQHKRGGRNNVSYPEFKEWREQSKVFTGLAGWTNLSMTISDDRGLPEQARACLSHGECLLGGRPAAAARARLRAAGRKARHRPGGHHRLSHLAEPLCRRSRHRRKAHPRERRAGGHRRGHAGRHDVSAEHRDLGGVHSH